MSAIPVVLGDVYRLRHPHRSGATRNHCHACHAYLSDRPEVTCTRCGIVYVELTPGSYEAVARVG